MKSDIEIAQEATMLPITEVAAQLGLAEDDLILYGNYKAKIKLDVIKKFADRPNAKYIDVTAITTNPPCERQNNHDRRPRPGYEAYGKSSIIAISPPSLGPVFGIKAALLGRILSDHPDGGLQPSFDGRLPCGNSSA